MLLLLLCGHACPCSDREFAGFGRPSEQYCDAHLDASMLPYQDIKVSPLAAAAVLYNGVEAAVLVAPLVKRLVI
jgi:hypothetical protein